MPQSRPVSPQSKSHVPHRPFVISSHPSQFASSYSTHPLCTSHLASLLPSVCQGCSCHRALHTACCPYPGCSSSGRHTHPAPSPSALLDVTSSNCPICLCCSPHLSPCPWAPSTHAYHFYGLTDTIICLFTRLPVKYLPLSPSTRILSSGVKIRGFHNVFAS